jgi:hypothetical protein
MRCFSLQFTGEEGVKPRDSVDTSRSIDIAFYLEARSGVLDKIPSEINVKMGREMTQ